MDLASFVPKDITLISTLAILALGWLGLRWLRDQQVEGYKHANFTNAVESVFTKSVQTDAYRERMNKTVSEAVTSSFEPVTTALREHTREIKDLSVRVGVAEGKIEGILGRMQTQRRGDIPPVETA